MPEYYSGKDHSYGLSGKINITRNPHSTEALLRKKKWEKKHGRPYPTEQEQHQNLLDKFGERVAKSEQKETNALVEQDYQVEHAPQVQEKQSVKQKETNDFVEHAPQVQEKQSKEQTPKPELKSRSKEQELEQIITPLIAQGEGVYKQNDYQNAYDIFSKVVAHQPDNSYALFHLSSSANQTRRYIIAVETAQKLIDSNQYTAQAYYFQAQSLEKMGRLDEARVGYQKAGAEIAEANKAFMRLEQDRLLSGFSPQSSKSSDTGKSKTTSKASTHDKTHQKQTNRTAEKAETLNVASLNPAEKLVEAVGRSVKYLPEKIGKELKAVFTPATAAVIIGVLGFYVAAHATGIGQVTDVVMLLAGGIFFGLDAITIFKDLAGFAGAINATTEKELDLAGEHLARAVAKIGVDAVMTLLTKKATDKIGKGLDNLNQVDEVHAPSTDDVTPGRSNPGNAEGANGGNLDNPESVNQSSASSGRTEAGLEPQLESQTVSVPSQLDNVAPAQKSQYLEAIATDVPKGEKLLEFGNFGSPERFKNVLNALDSVDDVERLKRVFNEDYINSLGKKMPGRYRRLLDDIADGNPPPVAEYAQPLSFSERLKVLDEVETVKTELAQKTKDAPVAVRKIGQRNIGYGSYDIRLPNGEAVQGNFVSTSGKTSGKGGNLYEYTGETLDDGRIIIPDFPKKKASKFFEATEDRGANDSERKAFEYIMGQIKSKLSKDRVSFKRVEEFTAKGSVLYEGQGFSGKITINSEMTPCNSCGNIIAKQFAKYFGQDISLEIKYGVEYENLPN